MICPHCDKETTLKEKCMKCGKKDYLMCSISTMNYYYKLCTGCNEEIEEVIKKEFLKLGERE